MQKNNHIKGLNRFINWLKRKQRDCRGYTLIEVLVAFLIIALISIGLIQTTVVNTRATSLNNAKTEAMALLNSEIEEIRLRSYDDIGIDGATGGDPVGELEGETVVGDYTITREVTWVEGEYSYKQVEVKAESDRLSREVTLVTQVYPVFGEGGAPLEAYPAPENLEVEFNYTILFWRYIGLNWDAPDAANPIDYYNIYRNGSLRTTSYTTRADDTGSRWSTYTYYVTAVYEDATESDWSNVVTTD